MLRRRELLGIVFITGVVGCQNNQEEFVTPEIGLRQSQSGLLEGFSSCESLEARLKANLSEHMTTQVQMNLVNYGRGGMMEDGDVAVAEASADSPSGENGANDAATRSTKQEGTDFSGTNNQEEGVDEADFVKTDGDSIFVINDNRLEIFAVPAFGKLVHYSSTKIEGHPRQMLKDGNKIAIYSQINAWQLPENHPIRAKIAGQLEDAKVFEGRLAEDSIAYWRVPSLTKVTVVDVGDRQYPTRIRHLYIEGDYKTGRKVNGVVRMVSYANMNIHDLRYYPILEEDYWEFDSETPEAKRIMAQAVAKTINENNAKIADMDLDDLIPRLYEVMDDRSVIDHTYAENNCQDFKIADDGFGWGFTSILTLDLLGDTFEFDADHILTNYSEVYASQDVMIIAEASFDSWWFWNNEDATEKTNIHRFDISEGATTVYAGSGRVKGLIGGQFALSEYEGFVRVASTTGGWGRWWMDEREEPANHVFVLEEATLENGATVLNQVGSVENIAPGERIWSSRFVEDEGYLVTFRNIDPLWTIDLSNPRDPKIKGELEVPGVSTYIHPLRGEEEGFLLTIGFGGDGEGLNWNTQISLFDVTNFSNPLLASALPIALEDGDDWYYAYSEANYEHKAFQYWSPRKLLAIPVSTYRHRYDPESGRNSYEYVSRLDLIEVDVENGLSKYGSVDHSDFFNRDAERWWNYRDVRRSIFMGDYIYAISDRGVTAHHLDTLKLSASYKLPGTEQRGSHWDF